MNRGKKKTPEEIRAAAKKLLENEEKFNKVFEMTFKKCDCNKDKKIDDTEYFNFINRMVTDFGLKPLDFSQVEAEFKKADKDKSGSIDKEELKQELRKKLEYFASDE